MISRPIPSSVPDPDRRSGDTYDVAIVGAGVVGCAIARELAHFSTKVVLIDAAADVGDGTSKANTAILHTGFDALPGTLESELVGRGYHLLKAYAAAAGIPVEAVGALLVAWDEEQLAALPGLAAKAGKNGYRHTRQLDATELYEREPHLGHGALGALEVPDEAIICPWTTTLAFATQAVSAGVELVLNSRVQDIGLRGDGAHEVITDRRTFRCHYLINAAGLFSDEVNRMLGHQEFHITPRRGELIVFDKFARELVSHILLPVPNSRGKGVLVAPTVYGNVILGPTAEDLDDKTDSASSESGLEFLMDKGAQILPDLLQEEVTTVYAGLRAASEHGDYQIRGYPDEKYVCVGGIRSTGLTSSMAIAEHVRGLLEAAGLESRERATLPVPVMPNIGEAFQRPYQSPELIAADPEYGILVCHCERVSRGEIRDALAAAIPPTTVEGLRRRTRVLMGRCQGFYCGAAVRELLERGTSRGLPGTSDKSQTRRPSP